MTNPYLDLYICSINFLIGIFFFIIYYGILLFENNKNKYIIYLIDTLSVLTLGTIYLLVINSNQIAFHIYNIIFICMGYLLGMILFTKQLKTSYITLTIIRNYILKKIKIISKWCFDILPFKFIIKKINKLFITIKIKRTITKINKKIKMESNK